LIVTVDAAGRASPIGPQRDQFAEAHIAEEAKCYFIDKNATLKK
jgi:hypothetical protein